MILRKIRVVSVIAASIFVFTGCATDMGVPQTRDEFVAAYKTGGIFGTAQHLTVNRSSRAVVRDVKKYARKCVNVSVRHGANYRYQEAASETTYHPKVTSGKHGVVWLTIQEEYNKRKDQGAPPGGIYTLAAEIRPDGRHKSHADIYAVRRGPLVSYLKQWIDGETTKCPSFARGW